MTRIPKRESKVGPYVERLFKVNNVVRRFDGLSKFSVSGQQTDQRVLFVFPVHR